MGESERDHRVGLRCVLLPGGQEKERQKERRRTNPENILRECNKIWSVKNA